MWMSDPSGGVSQSMLIGLGVWIAFAYLWTFAPMFGARRDVSIAYFGAGAVGGALGSRMMWWFVQAVEHGGDFWVREELLKLLNPWVGGYSSLGFLAGGGLMVLAMSRWGNIGRISRGRTLDVVVLSGFLGLVFARLGCVFNGCDFGKVSQGVNWLSIRYARGSLAWQRHYVDGLIGADQMWSLPTHGFPLYSAVATLSTVLGISLWAIRRDLHLRPSGMAAWIAIISFCCLQFVVEFLREEALTGSLGLQLNINQIALLGVLIIAGGARMIHARVIMERHREV